MGAKTWTIPFVGAIGAALVAAPAVAQKAHVHGEGVLNIAVENGQVLMELEAPGADIVGFEHEPKTDADKAAIAKAAATLEDGAALFRFSPDAQCTLKDADVEAPYSDDDHDGHEKHGHEKHGHEKHGHEKHGHDDKHGHAAKHDDHDKHGHDKHGHEKHGDHDKHDEEAHSEFHAAYAFQCANPSALKEMTTAYFHKFPGGEALDVSAILPSGQKAAELTAGGATFKF